MNRQIFFVTAAAAVMLCACQSSGFRISGRFIGNDDSIVYLEQVTPLAQRIVDSARLDCEGNYLLKIKESPSLPTLYNLIYNGEKIPLLVAGGDRLTVSSAGSVIRNYMVEGSIESELLSQFYKAYVDGSRQLESILQQYGTPDIGAERQRELAEQYAKENHRIRREQIRFIIEHKDRLAAVYALSQRLPGEPALLNGNSDVVYYRTVVEALEKSYPESPYLAALHAEISRMDTQSNLSSQIVRTGYPDLDMMNMYDQRVRLSSLAGKVILLDFWSPSQGNSNVLNAELKALYRRFADQGRPFEVYQVALDASKLLWINTVQEQQLPWVSVFDPRAELSPAAGQYNVRTLPANFLIDKQGTVVARDLYGASLERKLEELTR